MNLKEREEFLKWIVPKPIGWGLVRRLIRTIWTIGRPGRFGSFKFRKDVDNLKKSILVPEDEKEGKVTFKVVQAAQNSHNERRSSGTVFYEFQSRNVCLYIIYNFTKCTILKAQRKQGTGKKGTAKTKQVIATVKEILGYLLLLRD